MSPENMLKDPNILALFIGAIGKGKDFVITKGLTVLITTIVTVSFSAGIIYNKLESIFNKVSSYEVKMASMEKDIQELKSNVSTLTIQVGDVKVDVGKINDWMRMNGPRMLVP